MHASILKLFFGIIVTALISLKPPSQIFDRVLDMPLG